MRIGVTGAAGHLGGYILGQLHHTTGHHIIGYDTHDIDPEMLGDIGACEPIDHRVGDITGTELDAVINCATDTAVLATRRDIPVIHVTGLDDLHAAEHHASGGRVALVRTGELYGHRRPITAPDGLTETSETITRFIYRALTATPIDLPAGGTRIGNWTFVEDAAHAITATLTATLELGPPTRPIEIGPNPGRSVHDAAYICAEAAARQRGHKPAINYLPGHPGPDAAQADTDTLWQIGIDPDTLTPLEDGIELTIANYADDFYTTR